MKDLPRKVLHLFLVYAVVLKQLLGFPYIFAISPCVSIASEHKVFLLRKIFYYNSVPSICEVILLIEKIKRAFLPYKTFIRSFSLKAACALLLLYIFGLFIEQISPVVLALIWAVVSALFSITLAYPFIIRKINTKEMFLDGSEVSKRINGRVGRLIFCFAVSAILVASLLIESLKWNVLDWVLACCSIPLYFSLAILIHTKIIKKEYKPAYQRRGQMLFTWGVMGVVLTILFVVISIATASSISSFGEAFSSTKLLFTNSSSALLGEIGKLGYLIDGFTAFGLSALGQSKHILYIVINIALCASSAFALAHLLGSCSLELSELKRVFLPIEETHNKRLRITTITSSIATLCIFACATFGLFNYAEEQASEAKNTGEYTFVETLIRDQVNITVYEIDGKTYDEKTINKTIKYLFDTHPEYTQARDSYVALINQSYETCDANIEGYVTWYFRPWYDDLADSFQRGFEGLTNPNSNRNEQEYRDYLTSGIDTSAIKTSAQEYNQMLGTLPSQTKDRLAETMVNDIPEWLAVNKQTLDEYFQGLRVKEELVLQHSKGSDSDEETYTRSIRKAIQDSRTEMLDPIQKLFA